MSFTISDKISALWTAQEAEIITGGRSTMPWRASSLSIRQQDIFPGDLFFASQGDNVQLAFEQGAAAVVVEPGISVPEGLGDVYPIMQVPCVYESLRALAKAARFRTHSLVIAVQGFEQRRALSNALCSVSDLYEGGRHLSSSLAAMPDDCDFSVFGMSPSLSPDVVIINKAAQLRDVSILESMPRHGIALLNIDDPAYMDAITLLKSSGVNTILTYGTNPQADAYMRQQIEAGNGVQTDCHIMGQDVTVQTTTNLCPHMPTLAQNTNMLLAAYMLTKMADMPLRTIAQEMAESYMSAFALTDDQPVSKVSLMKQTSANLRDEAIFRVKNMLDTGKGRRALVLDQAAPEARTRDFTLPTKLAGRDVMHASKKVSIFKNARHAVENMLGLKSLSEIVPDVLAPGDYVVFKSGGDTNGAIFSEALRAQN